METNHDHVGEITSDEVNTPFPASIASEEVNTPYPSTIHSEEVNTPYPVTIHSEDVNTPFPAEDVNTPFHVVEVHSPPITAQVVHSPATAQVHSPITTDEVNNGTIRAGEGVDDTASAAEDDDAQFAEGSEDGVASGTESGQNGVMEGTEPHTGDSSSRTSTPSADQAEVQPPKTPVDPLTTVTSSWGRKSAKKAMLIIKELSSESESDGRVTPPPELKRKRRSVGLAYRPEVTPADLEDGTQCEVCAICNKFLLPDDYKQMVLSQGRQTIIQISELKKDGVKERVGDRDSFCVHQECRRLYTCNSSVQRYLRKAQSLKDNPPLPAVLVRNCIICMEPLPEDYQEPEKYKKVPDKKHVARELDTSVRDGLLSTAIGRGDDWGTQIAERINKGFATNFHNKCYNLFRLKTSKLISKSQRFPAIRDQFSEAMKCIYQYMDESDECQFPMSTLLEAAGPFKPTEVAIKNKMLEHYGPENINFTCVNGETVVCMALDSADRVVSDYYIVQARRTEEEKRALVQEVAAIIRGDICTKYYDTSVYPSCHSFLDAAFEDVPETLQILLKGIFMKRSDEPPQALKVKCSAIGHAIISATRPHSFNSTVLLAVSSFIHRKFASRSLIDKLSALGFGASYQDTDILHCSGASHDSSPMNRSFFLQFSFTNADFSLATLNGPTTFHFLGGIEISTPGIRNGLDFCPKLALKDGRVDIHPISSKIPIVTDMMSNNNVRNLKIRDLFEEKPMVYSVTSLLDSLYLYGKKNQLAFSNCTWTAFLSNLSGNTPGMVSNITYLPFIRMPPTNPTTIASALFFASQKCKTQKRQIVCVTLDQPLFLEATEIVRRNKELSSNVFVRLGTYNLQMSFLDAIGRIMHGSGIRECLSEVYSDSAVDSILAGKHYKQAIRAHFLLQEALIEVALKNYDFGFEGIGKEDPLTYDIVNTDPKYTALSTCMNTYLQEIGNRGPTAKLWIQYIHMVDLLKRFIASERLCLWDEHVDCIKGILPYFHAAGLFLSAKCSHLYIQQLGVLEKRMAQKTFEFFTKNAMTICQTAKPCSSVPPDLAIEYSLMKDLHSEGGLTRGKTVTQADVDKWIVTTPFCHKISSSLETFTNTASISQAESAEYNSASLKRNEEDVRKLEMYLQERVPFRSGDQVVSLSSGVIGDEHFLLPL